MIKTDKIRKPQPALFYIIDYLWSGFAGLSVAMVVVALWAWGSAVFGEFMLPAPVEVFQKSLDLLKHFQENEIGISLWRSVVGISVALIAGLAAGLVAGSFKTAMALLKPVITILLAMPPIIWVVMALFWFGFGNPSVLFTIIVLVAPLTFASAAVGMASVNKQHEELFDAYKLGRLKKNPLSVYPASDGLCDFQRRRGGGDGGEGGDHGGTLRREQRRGRADCGREGNAVDFDGNGLCGVGHGICVAV